MNHPDLNQLAKEIFEANKAKGFHEVEHSNDTLLMLVITELAEAVEADRKGNRANVTKYKHYCELFKKHYPNNHSVTIFITDFEECIKDTLEDELADAVIKLLDLAGLRGIEPVMYSNKLTECTKEYFESHTLLTEQIYEIVAYVMNYRKYEYPQYVGIINYTLSAIQDLCDVLSIDLWLHVELKMKYNATRPYKHGKSY